MNNGRHPAPGGSEGKKIFSSIICLIKVKLWQEGYKKVIVAAAAGILFFGGVMAGTAGDSEPGSVGDPLVTRSYVDAQLKSYADKYMQWKVVELAPGQRLTGLAGAELIVRTGQAVVVDPSGSGIPDVTAGTNVVAGQGAALNHHLIIPRTDGRGISARAKAFVMYRGEIEVK